MKMKKWKLVLGSLLGSAVLGLSAGQAEAAEVGSNLILDTEKHYIIWDAYDQSGQALNNDARVLFDDGGSAEGWLKYDGSRASGGYSRKYTWIIKPVEGQTGQYYLRNNNTGFAVKADGKVITGNNAGNYVVSDKNKSETGGAYVFEVKKVEDGKTYVAIKSVSTNKYMTTENGEGNRTYVKFSDNADGNNQNSDWWCIEEDLMPGQEGKQVLWATTWKDFHYRIPAITTNNQGHLVAAADKRYDDLVDIGTNWAGFPNGHRIDLIRRISENNGEDWGETENLTEHLTKDPVSATELAEGFGDPVLVADRESNDVLLFSVSGSYGYVDGKGSPEASAMISKDGGETFEPPVQIHQQVYAQIPGLQAFFFSSGRSMQSRYIKKGSHYRIYSAVLGRTGSYGQTNANYVFFSDDFGTTWELLGGQGVAALPSAGGLPDEAKIEELPNGSVLITSRKGAGRYVSVYHYDESDPDRKAGTWDTKTEISYGAGNSTNGEVYIVYAKNKGTGKYGYLALQSLPTLNNSVRMGVSIFFKELGEQDVDAAGYASGWDLNNKYMIQENKSAYSTMTLQADGKIGFMWEERDSEWDILYRGISIEEITGDKYEIAFASGIGSVATPYQVTTAEQAKAVLQVYNREQVYWDFNEEAKAGLIEALEDLRTQAEEVLDETVLDTERAESQALQSAVDAAAAADENTEEAELIRIYRELQSALEIYEGLAELEAGLGAKIDAAKALLAQNLLSASRIEAARLSDAITAAENKGSSVTFEEISALTAELDEAMEGYRQADPDDLYVEARYNTNRIRFGGMKGVTAYTIKRSTEKDGSYTTVTEIQAVEGQSEYEFLDANEVKGTQYWYDVEMTGGEGVPDLEPEQDNYVTGIGAVQGNAADDQLHYNFLTGNLAGSPEGNPAYFDGSRIFEGSSEELNKVKNLNKGSVLISFKPDNTSGRKGLLILKKNGVDIPSSGDLSDGVGFVFFQQDNGFRWDSSKGGLRGTWAESGVAGSWNTFGFSNAVFTEAADGNNIVNSWNGTTRQGWDSVNWNGFLTRPDRLDVLTIGADKTSAGTALGYVGKIAYVTITDESMSQEEMNAYTSELSEILTESENQPQPEPSVPAVPAGFTAVAGDGEVVLSWTAAAGTVTGYEISVDHGTNWRDVSNVTSYTWTGLENGSSYTFLLRAVNAAGVGETATVSVTLEATVVETVEAPVFTPAAGTYTEAQTVEITTETEDAVIYYTTDGSTPDSSSTEYTGAVTVSESMTLKAIAVKEGMEDSAVSTAEYVIEIPAPAETKVAAPEFSKAAGTFTSTQKVAITTATEGAKIYYTTNGSTPTTKSTEYKGEISVDKSMLIRAVAVKDGLENSDVVSVKYEMRLPWIFTDLEEKAGWWQSDAVRYTYEAGIMAERGTGSGEFAPNEKLTRGMFVTVLYRMAGEPAITYEAKFPDVNPEKYYAKAITWANKNGIVDGKPDGTFAAEADVKRAEIAKMLKGYADYCGFDTTEVKDLGTFADGAEVMKSSWKKQAMQWATAVNMITGKDGKLAADDNATRVECAQMIRKFGIKYLE